MTGDPRSAPFWLGAVLAAVLLVPCLYVASVGPVVRYFDGEAGAWLVVYAPLGWLHDHTALRRPLEWYVVLWMDLLPGPGD